MSNDVARRRSGAIRSGLSDRLPRTSTAGARDSVRRCVAAWSVVMWGALCAPPAAAETVQRQVVMLSTDTCQPALPAFDGSIRKRPLAMQNEGTSTAFLTCGFKGLVNDPRSVGNALIGVALTAQGNVAFDVTCTLVNGLSASSARYVVRTKTVYPGIANLMFWTPSDFGFPSSLGLNAAALSCALPPHAAVLYTLRSYDDTAAQ